jgi:hypothetical protein
VLRDDERRALEELERSWDTEAGEQPGAGSDSPESAGKRRRGHGGRVLVVMGGVSFALLLAGVGEAAFAVFTTTLLGWLLWCVISQPVEAARIVRSLIPVDPAVSGSRPASSTWLQRYLSRLSEVE